MATSNPAALLDRLILESAESDWLEFKQNNADPDMVGCWISACANAAILAGKERAFLVFGVENESRKKAGTKIRLSDLRKGAENFVNWISRVVEPRLMMEFLDFTHEGRNFAIITVEPTYDRPVRFCGTEYIRIGENTKKLSEFPEHERALWFATGRRKFETAIALSNQSVESVLEKLDIRTFYKLSREEMPKSNKEIMRRLGMSGFIRDNMEGGYDITNLGAILFADDIGLFPSISGKSIRLIKYAGRDKSKSHDEREGSKGYAVGFAGLMRFIMGILPKEEIYIDGVRTNAPTYSEIAVREIMALIYECDLSSADL